MFTEERKVPIFKWEDLGDLKEGRPNLGPFAPVFVYRLLEYTFRDIMITEFGVKKNK